MLTGDNARTAAVAKEVGIDDVQAHLKPEDKSRVIAELARDGHVGMVGDGVNDAPALAAQNIALSLVILAVLVPGALAGVFALPVAVFPHELSELAVITNGLRLARK